jgi:hypothetical protein
MDEITQKYLNSIWLEWAYIVVRRFVEVYNLDEESYELYVELFLKANDWALIIGESLV